MTGRGYTPDTAESDSLDATFDRRMVEALVCPVTQAVLTLDVERSELISKAANLAYPIRDGIPIMLASEAREIG